ncbi:Opacity protein [Pseudovibrio ascidiaceicola]|uniref:Opacity protein n=1 Tax=Pseudovibrio ascidiaceicola TaxID=285279 RepID=A0A1I3YZM8_9HYPH|nr:Opacity protein [Pseudovibrio ascidiaceicola]
MQSWVAIVLKAKTKSSSETTPPLSMLKTALFLSVAGLFTSPAFAEDSSLDIQNVRDWTGLYGGVHTGGLIGRTTPLEYGGINDYGEYTKAEAALLAGLQAGYNRQHGNFVYGVEFDLSKTNFNVSQNYGSDGSNEATWNWLATARARAGLAVGDGLFYASAGLAFVDADYNFVEGSSEASHSGIHTGLAVGAGYEHAFDQNWSLRADYLFVGLPNKGITDFGGGYGTFTSSAHFGRLALNFAPGSNQREANSDAGSSGTWDGLYVGANAAALLGRSASLEYYGHWDYSEYTAEKWAAAGGLLAGYNFQHGNSVLGVEADVNLPSFSTKHQFSNANYINSSKWNWYSTLRVRAGLNVGNTLGYVTGGVAAVNADYKFGEVSDPDDLTKSKTTHLGLAIGAGVETAITKRISARLEYLHIALPEDFSGHKINDEAGSFTSSADIAKVSVSYSLSDGLNTSKETTLPKTIDWSGLYVGALVDGSIKSATATEYSGPHDYGEYTITDWAAGAGGLIGFNAQAGNFVYGLEADIAWSSWDQKHLFDDKSEVNSSRMPWLATARARAGLAAGNGLLYATAGVAIAQTEQNFGDARNPEASVKKTHYGYVFGAGVEHNFSQDWTARLEGLRVAFPSITDKSFSDDYPINFTSSSTMVRFGLTKRFKL